VLFFLFLVLDLLSAHYEPEQHEGVPADLQVGPAVAEKVDERRGRHQPGKSQPQPAKERIAARLVQAPARAVHLPEQPEENADPDHSGFDQDLHVHVVRVPETTGVFTVGIGIEAGSDHGIAVEHLHRFLPKPKAGGCGAVQSFFADSHVDSLADCRWNQRLPAYEKRHQPRQNQAVLRHAQKQAAEQESRVAAARQRVEEAQHSHAKQGRGAGLRK